MIATLYHNNDCSTSLRVKEELEAAGYYVTIVQYLTAALSANDILRLISRVNNKDQILRTQEQDYQELESKPSTLEEIANLIAEKPQLMQRPIVVVDGQAVVARPIDYFVDWLKSFSL